jgi:hypothetical protein
MRYKQDATFFSEMDFQEIHSFKKEAMAKSKQLREIEEELNSLKAKLIKEDLLEQLKSIDIHIKLKKKVQA